MASTVVKGSTGGMNHKQAAFARTNLARRPRRKIPPGKARPAIYYQFDQYVELTDGSVIMRRSQYPNDEIRVLQDQRNNPLWNPSREDLIMVDPNAPSQVDKFNEKFSGMFGDKGSSPQDVTAVGSVDTKIEQQAGEEKNVAQEDTAKKEDAKKVDAKSTDTRTPSAMEDDIDDYLSALDDAFDNPKKRKN